MMRSILIVAAAVMAAHAPARAAEPLGPIAVAAGRIVDLGVLTSANTDPRRVVVWLPAGYRPDGPRHAVLYMHDGQNLFDVNTAGYGKEWQIDEILSGLIADGAVRPTIVVGIWSTDRRLQEMVPAKAFHHLPRRYLERVRKLYGGEPLSDGYLKFIVRELKPRIDREFRVSSERANTFIMGSSMGALISLYAIDEYPSLFCGAGMLSTHWPLFIPAAGEKQINDSEFAAVSGAFDRYLTPALPDPRRHRLYFDHGSETLDARYRRYQAVVDQVVARRGYRQWSNSLSLSFPGQAHDEISWAKRVAVPLQFLLGPRPAGAPCAAGPVPRR